MFVMLILIVSLSLDFTALIHGFKCSRPLGGSIRVGVLYHRGQTPDQLGAFQLARRVSEGYNINVGDWILPAFKCLIKTIPLVVEEHKLTQRHLALPLVVNWTKSQFHGIFQLSEDSCEYEAALAGALDTSFLASKCSHTKLSDKRFFPTFARTNPPISKTVKSIISLLLHYSWDQIAIVSSTERHWQLAVEMLKKVAVLQSIKIKYEVQLKARGSQFRDIIINSKDITRVYVIMASIIDVMDFTTELDLMSITEKGQYVLLCVSDKFTHTVEQYSHNLKKVQSHGQEGGADQSRTSTIPTMTELSTLFITPAVPEWEVYKAYGSAICRQSYSGICDAYNNSVVLRNIISVNAFYVFDMVMMYLQAVDRLLSSPSQTQINGRSIISEVVNRTYKSIAGLNVFMDENGDAEGNFTVSAYTFDDKYQTWSLKSVAYFIQDPARNIPAYHMIPDSQIMWISGSPPLSEPLCGFNGQKCHVELNFYVVFICISLLIIVGFVALLAIRYWLQEQKLSNLSWKVDYKDIMMIISAASTEAVLPSYGKEASTKSNIMEEKEQDDEECNDTTRLSEQQDETVQSNDRRDEGYSFLTSIQSSTKKHEHLSEQTFINEMASIDFSESNRMGSYRGQIVHIKIIHNAGPVGNMNINAMSNNNNNMGQVRDTGSTSEMSGMIMSDNVEFNASASVNMPLSLRREMQMLRELGHDNLCRVVGLCLDVPSNFTNGSSSWLLLTAYCSRGSLRDILDNNDIILDEVFIASLTFDMIKGMIYLHDSQLGYHGNLRPTKCLVDSRWTLQLSGFGLIQPRYNGSCTSSNINNEMISPNTTTTTTTTTTTPSTTTTARTNSASAVIYGLPTSMAMNSSIGLLNPHRSRSVNARQQFISPTAQNILTSKYYYKLLCKAPEHLKEINPLLYGSQKGDVYSFGIIFHELVHRIGPWGYPSSDILKYSQDIIAKVRQTPLHSTRESNTTTGNTNTNTDIYIPHRPPLDTSNTNLPSCVIECLQQCWHVSPVQRPDFQLIRIMLKPMLRGLRSNIFDNMLLIMEKYAHNLEQIVDERTRQLSEEKRKIECLLLRMLPRSVSEQLKMGRPVEPEHYECVSLYFSDIVGFTALSADSTPMQVVQMLNDLYTLFDSILSGYDVYKVETIGDAYMVASGLPERNGDLHAGEIASMALGLLEAVSTNFKVRHRPDVTLRLRIGLHSGPVVAGVVGLRMPRYCLFGDTVNTASRMEATGSALKIHTSTDCKLLLDQLGGYHLDERGIIDVKGKGPMMTYFLETEDTYVRLERISKSQIHNKVSLQSSSNLYSGGGEKDSRNISDNLLADYQQQKKRKSINICGISGVNGKRESVLMMRRRSSIVSMTDKVVGGGHKWTISSNDWRGFGANMGTSNNGCDNNVMGIGGLSRRMSCMSNFLMRRSRTSVQE